MEEKEKNEKPTQQEKESGKDKSEKERKKQRIGEKKTKEKKRHDDGYIMKKNAGMKVLRAALWIMLIFIFIRGIATVLKPDKEEEVNRLIRDFRADYSEFTNQNNEVMAFAQNFAREYLTYEIRGEEDYKRRLKAYVSTSFLNEKLNDFKRSASAVYVQAYRMEEYSADQVDVYVLAEVEYTSQELDADGQTYNTRNKRSQVNLSIPIYISPDQTYVVEGIPLMVSDSIRLDKYNVQEYVGTSLDDSKKEAVRTAVDNFLKAYFEQDESVINYYLDSNADRSKFVSLQERFAFLGISDLKCYQEEGGDIICIVKFNIRDADNQAEMLQKINLSIREAGGKYYIKSMGTRTGNLIIS